MKVASSSLTLLVVTVTMVVHNTAAFAVGKSSNQAKSTSSSLHMASVGLYFSTIGGATQTCANHIGKAAGGLNAVEIDEAKLDDLLEHDCLIVGAPTWNTGADKERSMTSWDEWLYKTLPSLDLKGKKVAVFGVGDQVGYSNNYGDAVGELYDCFTAQGCQPFGKTSTEGYRHVESKAEVDGKFVGCMFDEDNQYDLSESRATTWVAQLKEEGFMAS
eukprot:CAMPEP_0119018232 /NCGR_PEP_ID=MMETSP1176-20130426/18875_1 /TAXON_ID=265551 /ORGANISM="Synedropsis recta cf, Strain CCMP1620" /LENGTH=216 /DNA_ID=CAMNT_0006972185 /DNA_START=207 /DNA_END=857 /DNA_ORIENTATION=+